MRKRIKRIIGLQQEGEMTAARYTFLHFSARSESWNFRIFVRANNKSSDFENAPTFYGENGRFQQRFFVLT